LTYQLPDLLQNTKESALPLHFLSIRARRRHPLASGVASSGLWCYSTLAQPRASWDGKQPITHPNHPPSRATWLNRPASSPEVSPHTVQWHLDLRRITACQILRSAAETCRTNSPPRTHAVCLTQNCPELRINLEPKQLYGACNWPLLLRIRR